MKGVGERWARDPEIGKGGYVPADMTYQEWKVKYVDKTGEGGIIKTDAMASTDKIRWPKKGKELSGSQRRELIDYANQKGIVLKGLTGADVDPVLIKEVICR